MQQPSFQKWGFARAKLVFAFPPMRADRGFSRKFHESSAKELAKVKAHFEGSGLSRKPGQKIA